MYLDAARLNFHTLDSKKIQRAHDDHEHEVHNLDGRLKNYALFKLNDVYGRAGMNDLLNMELRNDKLKLFDLAWEETLMTMEKMTSWKRPLGKSLPSTNGNVDFHELPWRSVIQIKFLAKKRRITET